METMKKQWLSPVSGVQKFVPQYCAAPCINKETDEVTWRARCNTSQSLVFFMDGTTGINGGTANDWIWDTSRGGCGNYHDFTMTAGNPITANSMTLPGVTINNWNTNQHTSNAPANVRNRDLWNGYELKEEYRYLLKEAYYNDECIGGGLWLVTNDLLNFHIVS